jgi:hypothetical protein
LPTEWEKKIIHKEPKPSQPSADVKMFTSLEIPADLNGWLN